MRALFGFHSAPKGGAHLLGELGGVARRLPLGHLLEHLTRRLVRGGGSLALARQRNVEPLALGVQLARALVERVRHPCKLRCELCLPGERRLAEPREGAVKVGAALLQHRVAATALRLDGVALDHLRTRDRLTQLPRFLTAECCVVRRRAAHRRHVGIRGHQHRLQAEDSGALGGELALRSLELVARLIESAA